LTRNPALFHDFVPALLIHQSTTLNQGTLLHCQNLHPNFIAALPIHQKTTPKSSKVFALSNLIIILTFLYEAWAILVDKGYQGQKRCLELYNRLRSRRTECYQQRKCGSTKSCPVSVFWRKTTSVV